MEVAFTCFHSSVSYRAQNFPNSIHSLISHNTHKTLDLETRIETSSSEALHKRRWKFCHCRTICRVLTCANRASSPFKVTTHWRHFVRIWLPSCLVGVLAYSCHREPGEKVRSRRTWCIGAAPPCLSSSHDAPGYVHVLRCARGWLFL